MGMVAVGVWVRSPHVAHHPHLPTVHLTHGTHGATSLARKLARMPRLFILAFAVVFGGAVVSAQTSEEAGVRAAINQYFKGHATNDAATMRGSFLPTAHIEGNRRGQFTSWTVDEYVANFKGAPAPDEATRKRTIDVIDVNGTAAMARATLVHGATTFTDYFVLLKVDGAWKIANKVYSAAPSAVR